MPITATNAFTSQVIGTIDLAGAEISAYDPASQRVFTTSGGGLQIIDLSDPTNPQLIDAIDLGGSDVTSVAVHGGLIAVAVPAETRTDPGKVYLLDADGNILAEFEVGSLPDMVTFSPDGSKILVANEGEATFFEDVEGGADNVNPVGSISVVDLSSGIGSATVQTAGFEDFNDDAAALIAEGVRLFVNTPGFEGITVAQDLEPEYIAISADGLTAWVTLQEANSIAIVDLSGDAPVVTDIMPLGLKDWSGLNFDGSDRDDGIEFHDDLPIFGMYMPDAITSFVTGGQTYYITANEGDDRNDFLEDGETERLDDFDLDDTLFPNEGGLLEDELLGRLNVPNLEGLNGDTDGDGDIDIIQTYGGRSFTIYDASGNLVFDSGDLLDTAIAELAPELFDDGRSDNKGSEPEGVTVATFDGHVYAFVTLERFNSTIVFDVTDPTAPTLTTVLANAGDVAPEAGIFVSAADSATGQPLFIVSNETSHTLTVYQLGEPNLEGSNGQDTLLGTIGDDELNGANGDDFIFANLGDDELFGGNGDDVLDGSFGNDTLSGGNGNDRLTTGTGEDVIVVGRGNGEDVVTDFDTDFDAIQLQGGVLLKQTSVADHDGNGTDDLILSFQNGGGTLILLGVSDASAVDFVS